MPTLTPITLTATFKHPDTTLAADVLVEFTWSDIRKDPTGNVVVTRKKVTGVSNGSGVLKAQDGTSALVVYATNDPTTQPGGVTGRLRITPPGGPESSYAVVIPFDAAGGTIDLADLLPVQDAQVQYGVSSAQYALLDSRVSALEGGATASTAQLKEWALDVVETFKGLNAITYHATYKSEPATATINWPDGSSGAYTVTSWDATRGEALGYTATHVASGQMVKRPDAGWSFDANHEIASRPALTVI